MRAISLLFHDVYVSAPDESGFSSEAAHRYKLSLPAFEAQLAGIADSRAELPVLATSSFADRGGSGDRGDDLTQSAPRAETRGDGASRWSPAVRPENGSRDREITSLLETTSACDLPGSRSMPREARVHRLASAISPLRELCVKSPLRSPLPLRPDHTRQLPYLITFDDGGLSYYTLAADRLESRGWRGHCLVSTDLIGRPGFLSAAQIRELDARGHVIGSHSASHPRRFSACTHEQMREEWSRSRRALEDLLGHAVDVASVPGGYFSRPVALAARDAGIRVLFTSEPVTSIAAVDGCTVIGRFTIRRGDAPDAARRLVMPADWARARAWIGWNAKGLIKPLLGQTYIRIADGLAARRPVGGRPAAPADAS